MSDVAAAYAEGRARITELVAGLDADSARVTVPCCPMWSVKDVVSHLTGVCADIVAGNIAGVATDPWTHAQVEARKDRSLPEILAEWSEVAPQVEAFASAFPERMGEQWVLDLTTHEHDIRGTLGQPGARDSDGIRMGVGFMVELGMATSLTVHGLPTLRVRGDGEEWIAGDSEPVDTLEASPFEVMRALTGRRSAAQIRALGWSCDPEPYLSAFGFGPFTVNPSDIVE